MKRLLCTAWMTILLSLTVLPHGVALAGAPSITPDMPPEILSWRDEILSKDEYQERVDQWRDYIDMHPRSAVAHVQLARALRYAGTAPVEERQQLILKALELDRNCPEAVDAMADTGLHSEIPLVTLEEAIEYGERAVRLAPSWPFPHFNLWAHAVVLNRHEEAEEHLRALIRKNGIPSPLLDFNYNMLMSAEPEAIVFTNGDNDTYPSLALQVARGVRTDVTIVNLSLLNRKEYAQSVWKRAFGSKGPFTRRELETLHDRWKKDYRKSGELYATKIMRALVEKVGKGDWRKPVYFAITVAEAHLDACDRELEIEGLLWRVKREPKRELEDEEPGVNLWRTRRLIQEEFRLESATDLGYPWTPTSAIRLLLRNYPATLRLLATASAAEGDLETVRYALGKAIQIADFHRETDLVEKMARYWKDLDPDNPEVDRWL